MTRMISIYDIIVKRTMFILRKTKFNYLEEKKYVIMQERMLEIYVIVRIKIIFYRREREKIPIHV